MYLGALALFVVSLGYGVVVPLLPALTGGGTSAGQLSVVYALYAVAKLAAQVPGGVWVDRRGALVVLRVSLLVFTASIAGFLLPGHPVLFALVRALEGAATGVIYPAVFALVMGAGGTGRALGVTLGLGSAGLLVGPGLAAWLAPRAARLPVAVVLALSVLAYVLSLRRLPRALPEGSPPARSPLARSATVTGELRALVARARSRHFVGLLLPVALNKLVYTGMQGVLPLHGAQVLGLSLQRVTLQFVAVGVTFGLAQPLGGVLADRVRAGPLIAVLLPASAVCLSCLAFASTELAFDVALVGWALTSALVYTAVFREVGRRYGGPGAFGGIFGVANTLTDAMTIAGPLLFLNLYGWQPRGCFIGMSLAAVPFGLATWVLRSGAHRQE